VSVRTIYFGTLIYTEFAETEIKSSLIPRDILCDSHRSVTRNVGDANIEVRTFPTLSILYL